MSALQAWPGGDFDRRPLPPRGDAFGVRAMLDTLRQQRRPALIASGLVLAATLLYGLLAVPVFKTDTLLQLSTKPRATLLPTLEEGARGAIDSERREASGEIEVLRSRDVLLPVIESVGADVRVGGARRWGFVPVGARHGIESVRLKVPAAHRGQDFALAVEDGTWALLDDDGKEVAKGISGLRSSFALDGQSASIEVKLRADAPRVRATVRQEHALKAYEAVVDRLRLFEPARESGVVRISYEDSDPLRAATLLNGMVAAYLQLSVKRHADEGNEALAYLEGQLPPLEARVRAAEEALASYQKSGVGVSTTVEAEALSRQRGELERQLVDMQVKLAQLSQNLTTEHPDVAALLAQIASVRGALGRTGASRNVLPAQQRDLVRLQRDVQISTQQYTALLDRAQQLRIATASWLAGARQVDRAAVPIEPARPKALALASIGVGLALLMAIVAALMSRALRTTVSDVIDIEATLGPATVASIPQSSNQPRLMEGRLDDAPETDMGTHRLLARAAPQDPAVEGLRAVHMSLMLRARSIEAQVILVTAPSYGAGKSFVASNLAALMAESGKRVLLIEGDMRHPAVHRYVGLDPHASGLSEVLCGARALDEVIYPHTSANLDTLMQGTMTDNPGSLLLLPELGTTLQTLRARYDHIVIHTPPLGAIGDALAFAPLADCFLLVVRAEQSLLDDAKDAVRRLERAGLRLEGVIFNGVRSSSRHSGLPPM